MMTTRGKRTFRRGIASTLTVAVALLMAAMIGLVTWLDVQREQTIFRQQLEERAVLLAQTLAEVMADALYFPDVDRARDTAALMSRHPDVAYVEVYDAEGRIVVSRGNEKDPAGLAGELGMAALRDRTTRLHFTGDAVEAASPVRAGDEILGGVSFALSSGSLDAKIWGIILEHLVQGLLLSAVGVVLAYALAQYFTRPLWRLVGATERVASGDLDGSTDVARGDEFGELARSFHRMTAALKESRGQLQQALGDRDRRLQEALAELRQTQQRVIEDERLRAMGQMASGIAHDFNNALAPILGFTELLLRRFDQLDDKAEIRSHLELIHIAAQDAANVIGRLSEFYGGRNDGERQEAIDLNAVVEQAIALTQPRWKDQALARGVTIAVHADLHPVPALTGSDAELREALTNLIFNAVDAMPAGGTLTLRTRAEDACVAVEVGDTGTGMPEEVRRRCLEPFFSTKGDRGTGLGLAIVHGIVQRHDGTLDIESALDVGTTVRLRLPITGARAEGRRPEAGRVARSLRVLVVDDEPRICELLTAYLASDGHRVEAATCGREALDKFRAGRFDAVLTDRGMPEMNGDHLATAIKELSPSTPVVLVTGFGEMMKASGEWPDGIDAIVSKPFTLAALRHTLAQLAGPAPRSSAADV